MAKQPTQPNTPTDFESVVALKVVEILTNNGKLLDYMKKLNIQFTQSTKGLEKHNKFIKQTDKGFEKLRKSAFHFGQTLGNINKSLKTTSTLLVGFVGIVTTAYAKLAKANSEFMELAIVSRNADKSLADLKQTYLEYAKSVNVATLSQQDFAKNLAQFKGRSSAARYIAETDASFVKAFSKIPVELSKSLDKDYAMDLWQNFTSAFDPAQLQKMLKDFDFNSQDMAMQVRFIGGEEAYNSYLKINSVIEEIVKSENNLLAPIKSWNELWNKIKTVFQNASTSILSALGDKLPKIITKLDGALKEIPPIVERIANYIENVDWVGNFEKVASVVKSMYDWFSKLNPYIQAAAAALLMPGVGSALTGILLMVGSIGKSLLGIPVSIAKMGIELIKFRSISVAASAASKAVISGGGSAVEALSAAANAATGAEAAINAKLLSIGATAGVVAAAIAAIGLSIYEMTKIADNYDPKQGLWRAMAGENLLGSKMTDFEFQMRGIHPDQIAEEENKKVAGSDIMKKTNAKLANRYKIPVDVVTTWKSSGSGAGSLEEYLKKNNIKYQDTQGGTVGIATRGLAGAFKKGWDWVSNGKERINDASKAMKSLADNAKYTTGTFANLNAQFDNIMGGNFGELNKGLDNVRSTMTSLSDLMELSGTNSKFGRETVGQTAASMSKATAATVKLAETELHRAANIAQQIAEKGGTQTQRNTAADNVAKAAEKLANVRRASLEALDLDNRATEIQRSRQEQITGILQTQLEISKGLFGAPLMSVANTQKVIASLQQEQGMLEKELSTVQKYIAEVGETPELLKRELDLQNKIQGKLLERVNVTKELRDGYLDAVTAQAFGAGKFEKLIITQEKNIGTALRKGMVKNSYLIGSVDKMSQANPVRFSDTGLGNMTGANGQALTSKQMADENNKRIATISDPLTRSVMQSSQQLSDSINRSHKENSAVLNDNTDAIKANNSLLMKYTDRGTALAGVGRTQGSAAGQTMMGEAARKGMDPLGNGMLKAIDYTTTTKATQNAKAILPALKAAAGKTDILGYDMRTDQDIAAGQRSNRREIERAARQRDRSNRLSASKAGQGPLSAGVKKITNSLQEVINTLSDMAHDTEAIAHSSAPPVRREKPGRGANLS